MSVEAPQPLYPAPTALTAEPPVRRMPQKHWVILLAYVSSLFWIDISGARPLTGHESFVAQAAREMLATGDWIVPRIGGKPWLEKPPLPHWIVATTGALFGGVTEFTARLPSTLAGLLGVCLVASLAARWFGPTHGLLAGLIQATTVYTLTYARLAEADIYLWLLVLGCLAIFANAQVTPSPPVRWYSGRLGFYVLLGLTSLTKGPLFGAVLAVAPCIVYLAVCRRWDGWRWFLYWPGLLVCSLITVAWPLAILARYPGTTALWWTHTFARIGGNNVLNPEPLWHYFETAPWQLLPWTLVVPWGVVDSFRRARHGGVEANRFLWVWFLVPFVILSLVKAKHHHYLIYALPPFSFWAAEGLLRLRPTAQRICSNPRLAWALFAGCLAMLAGGVCVSGQFLPAYQTDLLVLLIFIVPGGVVVGWCCARGHDRGAAAVLFGTLWFVAGYVHLEMIGRNDPYREQNAFMGRIDLHVQKDRQPLLVYRVEPSRLLLYMNTPFELYPNTELLRARAYQLPQAYVITSLAYEAKLRKLGVPTLVDQVRNTSISLVRQLALYRVQWYGAPTPGGASLPTAVKGP